MSAYDPADRHVRGVGPAPRQLKVARDYVRIPRVLDQTRVCNGCGAVLWYGESCPSCAPRRTS